MFCELIINKKTIFRVARFTGHEICAEPFEFKLSIAVLNKTALPNILGQEAELIFSFHGESKKLKGIIYQTELIDKIRNKKLIIVFVSKLMLLKNITHPEIYVDKAIPEIIENNLKNYKINFKLSKIYPILNQTTNLLYQNKLDFINNIINKNKLFYIENNKKINFYDNNLLCDFYDIKIKNFKLIKLTLNQLVIQCQYINLSIGKRVSVNNKTYLIKKISHIFTQENYRQNIVLSPLEKLIIGKNKSSYMPSLFMANYVNNNQVVPFGFISQTKTLELPMRQHNNFPVEKNSGVILTNIDQTGWVVLGDLFIYKNIKSKHNLLASPGKNSLLINDKKNRLYLNNNIGKLDLANDIILRNKIGSGEFSAQKNMVLESKSFSQKSKSNTILANKINILSRQAQIRIDEKSNIMSKRDLIFTSNDSMLESKRMIDINSDDKIRIACAEGEVVFIQKGSGNIQANSMEFRSNNSIQLQVAGAKITLDSTGTISIIGEAVNIHASESIALKGRVHWV